MRLALSTRPFSLCWRPSYATPNFSPFSGALVEPTPSRWWVIFGPLVIGGICVGPFILVVSVAMWLSMVFSHQLWFGCVDPVVKANKILFGETYLVFGHPIELHWNHHFSMWKTLCEQWCLLVGVISKMSFQHNLFFGMTYRFGKTQTFLGRPFVVSMTCFPFWPRPTHWCTHGKTCGNSSLA